MKFARSLRHPHPLRMVSSLFAGSFMLSPAANAIQGPVGRSELAGLGTLSGTYSKANGINNNKQGVGWSEIWLF